ncbi:gas vesicle protein [Halosegnis sp.]|uniref:gas vesicle protein GvpO n=1 Tax=Halosegnis sp. TaxID=2864959 RepID=UPI0035D44C80
MADSPDDHPGHDNDDSTTPPSSPDSDEASATADADSADETPPGEATRSSSSRETLTLVAAQKRAEEAAKELLDHPFEGIIKAEAADGDGWRTIVEVVERSAVPDTQDIIGRYEIMLDAAGAVTGYELLERYRRNDMKEEL